jgi:hypothetical protein
MVLNGKMSFLAGAQTVIAGMAAIGCMHGIADLQA